MYLYIFGIIVSHSIFATVLNISLKCSLLNVKQVQGPRNMLWDAWRCVLSAKDKRPPEPKKPKRSPKIKTKGIQPVCPKLGEMLLQFLPSATSVSSEEKGSTVQWTQQCQKAFRTAHFSLIRIRTHSVCLNTLSMNMWNMYCF